MRLVPITAEDEALTVRLECDPEIMRHLGGPRPEADVRAAHKRRLKLMEEGTAQMFKIVSDDARGARVSETLGTVGIWEIDWKGPQAYEMGWLVLPEHQGKGVASEAAGLIIAQARSDPEIRFVYAFPAVSNAASNAVARKIGMSNQGAFDYEGFAGVLRCNNWCIDLGQPA
jgi:RimJ/RimL family protein N-acetyltransferase